MDKKGQMSVGLLVGLAVTLIVGAVLLVPIAQNVGSTSDLITLANTTVTLGANATAIAIPGSGISGSNPVIYNASAGTNLSTHGLVAEANNFQFASRQVVDGSWTATITPINNSWASGSVNLSYTAEPDGYITSGGGRSIAALITLLTALAVGAIAIAGVRYKDIFG